MAYRKSADGVASKGKTKGMMLAKGGMAKAPKKESKAMMKKEVEFMKKKGAPKSMLRHEMAEAAMKKGGAVKKMRMGGETTSMMDRNAEKAGRRVTKDLEYDDKMDRMMKKGGAVKKMRYGGRACK